MSKIATLDRYAGYRWYYTDAVVGDRLVVVVFMRGPAFSARELSRERRHEGGRIAAIHAAIYRGARREAWVSSEFQQAEVSEQSIKLGSSLLYTEPGVLDLHVEARQSPWPKPIKFDLSLRATAGSGREVVLAKEGNHRWQALMPRANASLRIDGQSQTGQGYHETNFGQVALGIGLSRWYRSRIHGEAQTTIAYLPESGVAGIRVTAGKSGTTTEAYRNKTTATRTSRWGLVLPTAVDYGDSELALGPLIESSPFHARLWHNQAGIDVLTEVADFARFRSPFFSWITYFRSRSEAA